MPLFKVLHSFCCSKEGSHFENTILITAVYLAFMFTDLIKYVSCITQAIRNIICLMQYTFHFVIFQCATNLILTASIFSISSYTCTKSRPVLDFLQNILINTSTGAFRKDMLSFVYFRYLFRVVVFLSQLYAFFFYSFWVHASSQADTLCMSNENIDLIVRNWLNV